jgi:hypothetical protein
MAKLTKQEPRRRSARVTLKVAVKGVKRFGARADFRAFDRIMNRKRGEKPRR